MAKINYRLGLKIGTNSISWCAFDLLENHTPHDILDSGVHLFHNGREVNRKNPNIPGTPLAAKRTEIRGIRRRNDRIKKRKRNVLKKLEHFGLSPKRNKLNYPLDILRLRDMAVTQKLEPEEIGRIFYILQKNRGYKSNRRDLKEGKKPTDIAIKNLNAALNNNMTLGQFLYRRNVEHDISSKFRGVLNEKNKLIFNFFPSRHMIEHEFDTIWHYQKQYYPDLLSDEAYAVIRNAIFYQRPLKPPSKGKCTLLPTECRMDWALPSAQRFRIIKEVNNMGFTSPDSMRGIKLNQAQRKKLYTELCLQGSLTFKQIKKLLDLSSAYEFNLDTNDREKLEGDRTAKIMRDIKCFGNKWDRFTIEQQDNIITILQNEDETDDAYMDEETLWHWLISKYEVSEEQANNIMAANLPKGCSQFGKTVITSLLSKMTEGMLEHEAISFYGWKVFSGETGEIYDKLPYYGEILGKHVVEDKDSSDPMIKEFGRLSNPSAHIAFNELRRLMNILKDRYGGWPEGISLHIERNLKKGTKEITKIMSGINSVSKRRKERRNEIERYKGGEAKNEDYQKMELWHELAEDPTQRKCIFTGRTISINMLFNEATEISYILPYSKTLDNTNANRILITAEGAYIKNNLLPYEAFIGQNGEYSYQSVLERSKILPKSKQWRFLPEALEIFKNKATTIILRGGIDGEVVETDLDPFAVAPLNDTDYLPKIFRKYLSHACNRGIKGVIATPNTLTGLLRASWGLNDLLRNDQSIIDHREGCVDAFVIGLTNYFTVKRVAEAALLSEKKGIKLTRILSQQLPYVNFDWEKMQSLLQNTIVCYKPDHSANAQLHEETYYGFVENNISKKTTTIVTRAPVNTLIKKNKKGEFISYIDNIRDEVWKKKIKDFIGDRQDLDIALSEFIHLNKDKVRGLRLLSEVSDNTLIPLEKFADNVPIKLVQSGSNHRVEIYCPVNGNNAGKWQMEIIRTFDANTAGFIPLWKRENPDAQLIMILHIGDMVAYEDKGKTIICRVKKIASSKTVFLIPHNIANREGADSFAWGASAKQLQLKKARHIIVKMTGEGYDPLVNKTRKAA